jgi:hypothetical protein
MAVSDICAQAMISRKVFYFRWNRYHAEGWNGLKEKQRGRPHGPELDSVLRKKVVKLRERYGWGPNKIAGHLTHKGCVIDHNQSLSYYLRSRIKPPYNGAKKDMGN